MSGTDGVNSDRCADRRIHRDGLAAGHGQRRGTDRANARLDAVRTGLAAGAGAGAAVGLMLAFRRQHHQLEA
jgi:hypothetical protein